MSASEVLQAEIVAKDKVIETLRDELVKVYNKSSVMTMELAIVRSDLRELTEYVGLYGIVSTQERNHERVFCLGQYVTRSKDGPCRYCVVRPAEDENATAYSMLTMDIDWEVVE